MLWIGGPPNRKKTGPLRARFSMGLPNYRLMALKALVTAAYWVEVDP
jgi:hypothetical protein